MTEEDAGKTIVYEDASTLEVYLSRVYDSTKLLMDKLQRDARVSEETLKKFERFYKLQMALVAENSVLAARELPYEEQAQQIKERLIGGARVAVQVFAEQHRSLKAV